MAGVLHVPKGSEACTRGVRVSVQPSYVPEQSDPAAPRFLFAYRIRIFNESAHGVQLLSREWQIVDADGERRVVRGEGVVGQKPRIEPGATYQYESFCPLPTPWGTMEGRFFMASDDGQLLEVTVARFYLVASGDPE